MDNMDKEVKTNQAEELQKLVDTWSAMQKYAFYVGTSRGVLSCLNTLCLRFGGMSFEEYCKRMVKPQLTQMLTLSQALQLLGSLLQSINELIKLAESEAKLEVTKEENAVKTE